VPESSRAAARVTDGDAVIVGCARATVDTQTAGHPRTARNRSEWVHHRSDSHTVRQRRVDGGPDEPTLQHPTAAVAVPLRQDKRGKLRVPQQELGHCWLRVVLEAAQEQQQLVEVVAADAPADGCGCA
jgi:hypothetical protein